MQFLRDLFPGDSAEAAEAVREYLIGTGANGETIFWQVDRNSAVRTGKIIDYDQLTGKRRKGTPPNWVHAKLKSAGLLEPNFALEQCLFGEHLLRKYSDYPVAIVEAEKTAILASICKLVFPEMVWLATGGKSNFRVSTLESIGLDRRFVIYPDADAYADWRRVVDDAKQVGFDVSISSLIETYSNEVDKGNGSDLADYLISAQLEINNYNRLVENLNADPVALEEFDTICEERRAIIDADQAMRDDEIENYLSSHEFVRTVLHAF